MNIDNSLRARRLNQYHGNVRPKVDGIILHDTAGSGTDSDARYLANDPENRGVSVDFVVLRNGTIFKLNPDLTRYSTNHAGRHTRFKDHINGNVNAHTIGIELSHNANPARQSPEWPPEQIQAVAQLCADLCQKFTLERDDISTHARIITDGSRSDPRNFPWSQFWAAFDGTELNSHPTGPVYHDVVDGDTLWAIASDYHTTIEAIKALNGMDTPSTLITVGQHLLVKE